MFSFFYISSPPPSPPFFLPVFAFGSFQPMSLASSRPTLPDVLSFGLPHLTANPPSSLLRFFFPSTFMIRFRLFPLRLSLCSCFSGTFSSTPVTSMDWRSPSSLSAIYFFLVFCGLNFITELRNMASPPSPFILPYPVTGVCVIFLCPIRGLGLFAANFGK